MGLAGIQGCPRVDSGLRRNDMGARRRCAGDGRGLSFPHGVSGNPAVVARVDSGLRRNDMGAQAVCGRRAGVVIPAWG